MGRQELDSRTRKRKHGERQHNVKRNTNKGTTNRRSDPRQQEEALAELQELAQSEAEDLQDLTLIASEATPIEFDDSTGHPISIPASCNDNNNGNDGAPIEGILKISQKMLLKHEKGLLEDLKRIHAVVKDKVRPNQMVPWAGVRGDTTRLRAFGFLGAASLARLDNAGAVRLHAPEKQGTEALEDERANRRAICVLNPTREHLSDTDIGIGIGIDDDIGIGIDIDDDIDNNSGGNQQRGASTKPTMTPRRTVNPTLVADKLCAAILGGAGGNEIQRKNLHDSGSNHLNSALLSSKELIVYQTNLHNGAKHLAAHLDAPLHEGFGKVIVTVAIRGSATILLIGKGNDDEEEQPAWKFRVEEGEAYVLSGNARNICLHAVLADDNDDSVSKNSGGDRESLNLRFGIHTVEEAENEIKRHWPDLW